MEAVCSRTVRQVLGSTPAWKNKMVLTTPFPPSTDFKNLFEIPVVFPLLPSPCPPVTPQPSRTHHFSHPHGEAAGGPLPQQDRRGFPSCNICALRARSLPTVLPLCLGDCAEDALEEGSSLQTTCWGPSLLTPHAHGLCTPGFLLLENNMIFFFFPTFFRNQKSCSSAARFQPQQGTQLLFCSH